MARRFIIEHPTRGVLKDTEWTDSGVQCGRFAREGSRVDGMMFRTLPGAMHVRSQIRPYELQRQCQIRQEPTESEVMSSQMGDLWKVVA